MLNLIYHSSYLFLHLTYMTTRKIAMITANGIRMPKAIATLLDAIPEKETVFIAVKPV